MSKLKEIITVIVKFVFSPIMDNGSGKISIGRSMLAVTFILSCLMWWKGSEIPNTMQNILFCLIGYVIGTKGLVTIKDVVAQIKGSSEKEDENQQG